MKKTISIVLLLFVTVGMYAQDGINYKALIKDNLGAVVASQTIDVKFTIIADTGPTNVYVETHTGATTDANGIVILTIGDGTSSDTFADIDWSSDTHSLKVEMDIEQDASFLDMGTTQFMSVPYSLQATTATTADNGIPTGGTEGQVLRIVGGVAVWVDNELDFDGDDYSIGDGDCNDNEAAINPDATEIIDGLDNNCDGLIDEANIGDVFEGGVVFYVAPTPIDLDGDGTLDNGLVCALSDSAGFIGWGCDGTDLPSVPNVTSGPTGSGAEIGDGITNTNGILTDCPTAPAALAARSFGPEWFLPSANELNQMYVNKATLEAVAGFTAFSSFYWSSTESNSNIAWFQYFSSGNHSNGFKYGTVFVRAVRAF
jgi:hypothetical protein